MSNPFNFNSVTDELNSGLKGVSHQGEHLAQQAQELFKGGDHKNDVNIGGYKLEPLAIGEIALAAGATVALLPVECPIVTGLAIGGIVALTADATRRALQPAVKDLISATTNYVSHLK